MTEAVYNQGHATKLSRQVIRFLALPCTRRVPQLGESGVLSVFHV